MRHKYATNGIILAHFPVAEASVDVVVLTDTLGLLRARAQGVRKQGAKLASALQTLAEAHVLLVHGAQGWRVAGATLRRNWFWDLPRSARVRAGRVAGLFLRLAPGEMNDLSSYDIMHGFFHSLFDTPPALHDAAECLAALRLLRMLGLDAGTLSSRYDTPALEAVQHERRHYIARINRGIAASGL
ncbi:MAG: hypothetical protein B7X04_00215 [Parcubacteria group bacterium 21-54-25]|nr:MAG: hypothetical protein B7X04_00215 [Parcubacteria group bacterium 21-54-25]HQU07518.1 recombination protein O N-terminal domain-containing protein [Candidatus Paceibacterota bacterium]